MLSCSSTVCSAHKLQGRVTCIFGAGLSPIVLTRPSALLLQTVLNLQDSQVQDLLYLRQLLHGKLGQLARQRQALLDQLITCHQAASTPLDKAADLNESAEALRKNAAEEYRTVMQFASAFYCGVSSCWYTHAHGFCQT